MIALEKWKILTTLQKLPKYVGDLGKLIAAKGFKKLPKVQQIAQTGHTGHICLSVYHTVQRSHSLSHSVPSLLLVCISRFLLESVWPDERINIAQFPPNSCSKSTQNSFYLKKGIFQKSPQSHRIFGLLL